MWTSGVWAAVDARAAAARTRSGERAIGRRTIRCWFLDSSHTSPDTWVGTLMKTPVIARLVGRHDVSKPKAAVASWSAERMGPTIIAAPHRGHAQVARIGASVSCGAAAAVAASDVDGVASKVRARVTRAVRQVFARNPDWRMRT